MLNHYRCLYKIYWSLIGCQTLPAPGSIYCKTHQDEASPALLPSNLSKDTLNKLNCEQQKKTAELERDSIFVIEKIIGKKIENDSVKYHIKWENYKETTWEPEGNIPLIFRNYYNKTGNEKIPQPRIKHTKKIGSKVYHLLSWENEDIYWEEENAFSLEGDQALSHESEYHCQTRKVCLCTVLLLLLLVEEWKSIL